MPGSFVWGSLLSQSGFSAYVNWYASAASAAEHWGRYGNRLAVHEYVLEAVVAWEQRLYN